jgi:hypothetical protein
MQLTGRLSAIIIAAAILLGAGVYLMVMYGPNPATPSGNLSGIPVELLASKSSNTRIDPASFERYCLPPRVDQEKFLTTFWGMVVNKTGVDDSSAVLLDFSLTGYPDKIPHIMHFSFSSKKDWWSGSRRVIFSGDDEGICGCVSITPSRESPDISGKIVPHPSKLFSELEQISFSDLGLGGKELSINTGLGYGPPSSTSEKQFLLANGSVVPLHEITFDPRTSLVYPWIIKIIECTGEPGKQACGTSSSRPAVLVFSDQRLGGANVSVGD